MAKRYPLNRIKRHRVYHLREVSDALGCHRRTVQRWIKKDGLPAETSRKPWLIEGRALLEFLKGQLTRQKVQLALHHCYCLGCRSPREPDGKMPDYVHQTPETGRLVGLCPACGGVMNKVVRRADLEAIRSKIEVTVQKASPRLVSPGDPRSNVTFSEASPTHGKTQLG